MSWSTGATAVLELLATLRPIRRSGEYFWADALGNLTGRRATMADALKALSRRSLLQAAGAAVAGVFAPALVRAQGEPLRLGILTPLTGAGGFDGPRMLKAMQLVGD